MADKKQKMSKLKLAGIILGILFLIGACGDSNTNTADDSAEDTQAMDETENGESETENGESGTEAEAESETVGETETVTEPDETGMEEEEITGMEVPDEAGMEEEDDPVAEEEVASDEESDKSTLGTVSDEGAYPQNAAELSEQDIPYHWRTDSSLVGHPSSVLLDEDEIANFGTFKVELHSLQIQVPADRSLTSTVKFYARIAYINYEDYDIKIEDVVTARIDGKVQENLEFTDSLGHDIDGLIKANHEDHIVIHGSSDESPISVHDDISTMGIDIHSPFNNTTYGIYQIDL